MSRNEAPRPVSPELKRAIRKTLSVVRERGLSDEEIMGEGFPLFASSVTVRAGLDPQTPEEIRDTYRQVGNAIGAFMLAEHAQSIA